MQYSRVTNLGMCSQIVFIINILYIYIPNQ